MPLNVRAYTATLNLSTAVTTQLDVFEILAGTGKPICLSGFELGQSSEVGDAQEEELVLVLKRCVGSTSGSGGVTAPTLAPLQPNDTASGATIEVGNTTKLTGGTATELARFAWNVRSTVLYLPPPELRIVVAAGDRLVLELATTPADSITTMVGWVTFFELV